MPMDGCFIHYLTNELNSQLQDSKINRIYMPSTLDVILELRTKNRQNVNLLISSNLSSPRIHLTNHSYQVPTNPINFCMILRKYIERGIVINIEQVGNDRIIILNIVTMNELGDNEQYKLVFELMGRNSNIILVKDNIIIDAVRKLFTTSEDTRTIIPKASYITPKSDKTINPFIDSITSIDDACGVSIKLKKYLLNKEDIKSELNQELHPCIYQVDNKKDFYAYPLLNDKVLNYYESLSLLLDNYYQELNQSNDSITHNIIKELDKKVKQLKHKITLLEEDIFQSNEIIKNENDAVLLQSNLYKIKKGDSKVIVEDYFNNCEPKEIILNPLLDPSKNLSKIFTKIKKAKVSLSYLNDQIDKSQKEIIYLENIIFQLSIASLEELEEIRLELINNNYLKRTAKVSKGKKIVKPMEYIIDNVSVLVGKYNTQNEYLTTKLADKNDYWFHVKDAPGSHVIVRLSQVDKDYKMSEELIRVSANIAAYYSKSKSSSSVPVDYTEIRNIKKIPGEKGYHVTYKNQKTIYIDPDIELINKYKK